MVSIDSQWAIEQLIQSYNSLAVSQGQESLLYWKWDVDIPGKVGRGWQAMHNLQQRPKSQES